MVKWYRDLYTIYTNGRKLFIGLYIWDDKNFRHQARPQLAVPSVPKKSFWVMSPPIPNDTQKYKYNTYIYIF